MTDLTAPPVPAVLDTRPTSPFAELLELEQPDENTFRGFCHAGAPMRAFGGHVAAQALVAAGRTCEDQLTPHSLHGYFLLPGVPTRPIDYVVERLREGVTYTTRRVTAVQKRNEIFSLTVSFKRPEPANDRQPAMPALPGPESLPDATAHWPAELRAAVAATGGFRDLELRFVPADTPGLPPAAPGALQQFVWMRTASRLPDGAPLHAAALTYLSDLTLASTAGLDEQPNFFQRSGPPTLLMASLDHSMWFHRPFRADDWLLFAQRSPSSSDGRGLTLGEFYDRDGRLVASAAQEALIRRLT